MKKIAFTIAVLTSISISSIWAENNSASESTVHYVKTPKFALPLVEKWITEYAKTHPGVEFQIARGNQNQGTIDLSVVFENQDLKKEDFNYSVVYFGEFAVLPITSSGSKAAKVLQGKHLNSKKLKQLYFFNDDFEEGSKKNTQFDNLLRTILAKRAVISVANAFPATISILIPPYQKIRWAYLLTPFPTFLT